MNNNLNMSYEPMDVDSSIHSNHEMDISIKSEGDKISTDATDFAPAEDIATLRCQEPKSLNNLIPPISSTPLPSNVKTFHITRHKNTNSLSTLRVKLLCSVVVAFLAFISYHALSIQCSDDINPHELKTLLSNKVFGQSQAITSLIDTLNFEERMKILFFYGGTGVGKTFTASLILEHVGYYSNVYHYTMPSFMDTFTTDFMMGLTVCKHTTLVVDDLSANDMDVKTHIGNLITKSQNLDKNITIILIYNCDNLAKDFGSKCDESFPNKLLQNFNYIDAYKKLIKFEPLKDEHLRKCIESEMGNRKLNNIEFAKILKNFNVAVDGCKGVYTKIKLLEIS